MDNTGELLFYHIDKLLSNIKITLYICTFLPYKVCETIYFDFIDSGIKKP